MPRGLLACLLFAFAMLGCAAAKPRWIDKPFEEYPGDRFVVAVGSGPNLEAAKRDGMAGIAAFLGVEIQGATTASELSTHEREDGRSRSTYSGKVEEGIRTFIHQKLSSVALERAHTEGSTVYVLATLEKAPFLAAVQSEIGTLTFGLVEGLRAARAEGRPSQAALETLAASARSLRSLEGALLALRAKVPAESEAAVRDALAFLSRFDVHLDPRTSQGSKPAGPELPYDPGDARLKKAIRRTSDLVGREVEFRFIADQMPRKREFFDWFFDQMIGDIPTQIASMKRSSPHFFAYVASHLKKVEFGYDGTRGIFSDSRFDATSGCLEIGLADSGRLNSRWILHGLRQAFAQHQASRFARKVPGALSRDEGGSYFDFLAHWLPPRAGIPRMLQMERAVGSSDPKLAASIREWLLSCWPGSGSCGQEYEAEGLAEAGDESEVEAAWLRWFDAAFDGLSDTAKADALSRFLVRDESVLSPRPRERSLGAAALQALAGGRARDQGPGPVGSSGSAGDRRERGTAEAVRPHRQPPGARRPGDPRKLGLVPIRRIGRGRTPEAPWGASEEEKRRVDEDGLRERDERGRGPEERLRARPLDDRRLLERAECRRRAVAGRDSRDRRISA